MAITFARLKRDGGWGLRAETKLAPGSEAEVSRKDGSVQMVPVGDMVWTNGTVWLYSIALRQKREPPEKHSPEPPPQPPGIFEISARDGTVLVSAQATAAFAQQAWDLGGRYDRQTGMWQFPEGKLDAVREMCRRTHGQKGLAVEESGLER